MTALGLSLEGAAESIRVAVLGRGPLFCVGVRSLVARDPAVVVVGDTDQADPGAIRAFVQATTPHVVVADLQIPGLFVLCREWARAAGRPWVIAVAADGGMNWAAGAVARGVRGVVTETTSGPELLQAIHAVHSGQLWVGHRPLPRVADALAALAGTPAPKGVGEGRRLSPREQEVVRHVALGLNNRAIAARLGIREATVKAHFTHIFHKLGVRGRAQLLAWYHRRATARRRRR